MKHKNSTVFVHLLKGYAGTTFQVPPIDRLHIEKIYDVYTGNPLPYSPHEEGIEVSALDRNSSPADTIIAIVYDQPVRNVWKN